MARVKFKAFAKLAAWGGALVAAGAALTALPAAVTAAILFVAVCTAAGIGLAAWTDLLSHSDDE
jgi:hypothetical protein